MRTSGKDIFQKQRRLLRMRVVRYGAQIKISVKTGVPEQRQRGNGESISDGLRYALLFLRLAQHDLEAVVGNEFHEICLRIVSSYLLEV